MSASPSGGSDSAATQLEQLLPRYIGPMAKIYIARAGKSAVDDADLGPVRVQAPVARLSATPGRIAHLGPSVGAHNAEVYGHLLGLDGAALAELKSREVI